MNTAHIIKKPVITEKSLAAANEQNRYTFLVDTRATKGQIKEAVETYFNVEVLKIWTQTKKPVARRTGRKRLPSPTAKTKKAIVAIKQGQTIDAFSGA